MKTMVNDTVFRIYLPERISTDNAAEVEKELMGAVIREDSQTIELDAGDLKYISSVGLRIILKFKKNNTLPVYITDVGPEVYNILETTGFTNIFNVVRALQRVDTEGLQELGRGMYGAVVKVDDEKVLKVFYGLTSREQMDKILQNIRTAFVKGIPTIIPFETVQTDKGLGMMFELVKTQSLADMIHSDPEKMDECVGKMVDLARIMATTHFEGADISYRSDVLKNEITSADFVLTDNEIRELIGYIDAVPQRDTAVHGDFHCRNIYLSDGEALLIDMDDFSLGHPIWDIACLYRVYPYMISLKDDRQTVNTLFGIDDSVPYDGLYEHIMHVDYEEGTRLWELFIKRYFAGYDQAMIDEFLSLASFYSDLMVIRFLLDECRKCRDDAELLSGKAGLIRQILDRMRRADHDALIMSLAKWED